jgi:hypothetical protein
LLFGLVGAPLFNKKCPLNFLFFSVSCGKERQKSKQAFMLGKTLGAWALKELSPHMSTYSSRACCQGFYPTAKYA